MCLVQIPQKCVQFATSDTQMINICFSYCLCRISTTVASLTTVNINNLRSAGICQFLRGTHDRYSVVHSAKFAWGDLEIQRHVCCRPCLTTSCDTKWWQAFITRFRIQWSRCACQAYAFTTTLKLTRKWCASKISFTLSLQVEKWQWISEQQSLQRY